MKYWRMIVAGIIIPERRTVSTNRESKLLAIQIRADFVHTYYSLTISYIFGAFVTGAFADLVISYEHLLTRLSSIEFLIALMAFLALALYDSNRRYNEKIAKIYDDLDALEDLNGSSIGDDM